MEVIDIFEKAKFSAALQASTDKAFEDISISLIFQNWREVIGHRSLSSRVSRFST